MKTARRSRRRECSGTSRRDGRRGVALVVVLGFLAVLSVLALGFAVSMRVERLSSNTYYHGARTRHLLEAGLARAVDNLDARMLTANQFYPGQDVYMSGGPGALAGSPDPTLLHPSEPRAANEYIPDAVFPDLVAEINAVRWMPVLDPDSGDLIGRYAWIAVNCSGLLDANIVASESDREHGKTPGEIRLDHGILDEDFTSAANVNTFLGARDTLWRRFETLAELNVAAGIRRPASRFFTYSLAPTGFYDASLSPPRAAQPLYIGGPIAEVVGMEARIISHFEGMGLSPANARMAWENLCDYVDSGLVPRNLDSFGTKPVPMINEIVVETRLEHDGGMAPRTWTLTMTVRTELWYPFGGAPTSSPFTLRVTPTIVGSFSSPAASAQTTTTTVWNGSAAGTGVFETLVHTFTSTAQVSVSGDPPVLPTPSNTSLSLRFDLHQGPTTAGATVDRVQTSAIPWNTHFAQPGIAGDLNTDIGSRWEVDDPRINWRWANDWDMVQPKTNNMGLLRSNLGQINTRASFNQAGRDGTRHMYVRRGPLETVGEMAFLLYDASRPWQTIPLLNRTGGQDGLPVLDRFAVTTERTRRGAVNVGSNVEDALASVFLGVPIERWPSTAATPAAQRDPDRVTVSAAQAGLLAQRVIAARPFVNLSDIRGANLAAAIAGLDALQLDSIIRNSAGLLTARQNLFTIVVVAQSVIDANEDGAVGVDEVMGERRAVAVVWRDPYETVAVDAPANLLVNRSFVRFFRWLDE